MTDHLIFLCSTLISRFSSRSVINFFGRAELSIWKGHIGILSCVTVVVVIATAFACFPSMFLDLVINYFDLHLLVVEVFTSGGEALGKHPPPQ